MMNIKNLAELKKAISAGHSFTILKHHVKPEFNGQKRTPNVIQTNGFYSIIAEEPESPITKANGGKGYWIEYGKASEWSFNAGVCKQTFHGKDVWEIEFE